MIGHEIDRELDRETDTGPDIRKKEEDMSESKKVSIVVPIYNVEAYLKRCVDSLRQQSYQDLEIILVDDESPDGCPAMCDAFAKEDPRIKVVHKKNGGLGNARNEGAKVATGDYLLFVDSDDYISRYLVEKCVASGEKYGSDMVLFDYQRLEPDGSIEVCTMDAIPEDRAFTLKEYPMVLFESISAWNRMFRRDFFEKSGVRYPEGYYYEDLGSSPKFFLEAGTISYVKEAFYNYVIREGSIMTTAKEEKNFKDRCAMIRTVKKFYEDKGAFFKYRSELEYMALFHAYFIPAKEILYRKGDRDYIRKFHNFVAKQYPDYRKNIYLATMSGKEKLQFRMIDQKKYWVVNLLSWLRSKLHR